MSEPASDTAIDATRLPVMLSSLRMPSFARHWKGFAARADREGWGAARYLAALCEHELADRDARRIARHLAEAALPRGKTFATFEFAAVPTIRKAHLVALGNGDAWLDQGANILCFGPSVPAKVTPPRRSATPSSKAAVGSCSPAPQISFRNCRPHGAICRCRPR